jgi:hypothetical protein
VLAQEEQQTPPFQTSKADLRISLLILTLLLLSVVQKGLEGEDMLKSE